MALKSQFRKKLRRLNGAIATTLLNDRVSADLLPSLFSLLTYCWQRPSRLYHDQYHYLDY